MKPNDKQKPGCFDENIVFDQLEASGTIAFHTLMQMGYPVKVPIAEFYQKIKPYMTPGHGYESIGTINCCRFFLLASGFLSKDFKFGKTEIHIRSKNSKLLNQINIGSQDLLAGVAVKFNEQCRYFKRKTLYILLRFVGSCEFFLLVFVFASDKSLTSAIIWNNFSIADKPKTSSFSSKRNSVRFNRKKISRRHDYR